MCDEGGDVEGITSCRTPMCMPQVSGRVSGPPLLRRQNLRHPTQERCSDALAPCALGYVAGCRVLEGPQSARSRRRLIRGVVSVFFRVKPE